MCQVNGVSDIGDMSDIFVGMTCVFVIILLRQKASDKKPLLQRLNSD